MEVGVGMARDLTSSVLVWEPADGFEGGVICGGGRLAVSLQDCGTDGGMPGFCSSSTSLFVTATGHCSVVVHSLSCHYPKHAARHTQRPQPPQFG